MYNIGIMTKITSAFLLCMLILLGFFLFIMINGNQKSEGNVLVQISYSGGYLADEALATRSETLYINGDIVIVRRDGQVVTEYRLMPDEIAMIQSLIKNKDLVAETFIVRTQTMCDSWVDGVDTIWYLAGAHPKEYSSCDYELQNTALSQTLYNYLSRFSNSDSE